MHWNEKLWLRRSYGIRDINFFLPNYIHLIQTFCLLPIFLWRWFFRRTTFRIKGNHYVRIGARVMFFHEREFQAQCDLYFCCPSVRPYIKTRRCWKVSTFLGPRSKFTPIATSSNHNVINDHNTPNTFQLETCRQLRQGWTRRSCRLFSSLFFLRP